MKTFLCLLAAALLCGCGKGPSAAQLKENREAMAASDSNDVIYAAQDKSRAEREAQAREKLFPAITNEVVGLRNIIFVAVSAPDNNVSNWNAFVTAEYINHFGGVDRTNLSFGFTRAKLYANDSIGFLDCEPLRK
jgi:hypothetical protein